MSNENGKMTMPMTRSSSASVMKKSEDQSVAPPRKLVYSFSESMISHASKQQHKQHSGSHHGNVEEPESFIEVQHVDEEDGRNNNNNSNRMVEDVRDDDVKEQTFFSSSTRKKNDFETITDNDEDGRFLSFHSSSDDDVDPEEQLDEEARAVALSVRKMIHSPPPSTAGAIMSYMSVANNTRPSMSVANTNAKPPMVLFTGRPPTISGSDSESVISHPKEVILNNANNTTVEGNTANEDNLGVLSNLSSVTIPNALAKMIGTTGSVVVLSPSATNATARQKQEEPSMLQHILSSAGIIDPPVSVTAPNVEQSGELHQIVIVDDNSSSLSKMEKPVVENSNEENVGTSTRTTRQSDEAMPLPPSYSMPSSPPPLPKLTFWSALFLWLSSWFSITSSVVVFGLLHLVLRRSVLQRMNLIDVGSTEVPRDSDNSDEESKEVLPKNGLPYRLPDGYGTDPRYPTAGASGVPFGRNMPPSSALIKKIKRTNGSGTKIPTMLHFSLDGPPPQMIAQRLLARRQFKPAGDQFNILAAAWIQFMSHDWMSGKQDTSRSLTLKHGKVYGCPLQQFQFWPTSIHPKTGTAINEKTHWWDTSVVYGSDAASLSRVRTYKDGLLLEGPSRGVLPQRPSNDSSDESNKQQHILNVGDNKNSWAGVQLLQDLFIREHNAIARALAKNEPHLKGNDEALFQTARLVVNATAAKIHTVDWTIELLKTPNTKALLETAWHGLSYALRKADDCPPPPPDSKGGAFTLIGSNKKQENHGVPFVFTEEFVAVYRLHSMLPDVIPLSSSNRGHLTLEQLTGQNGERMIASDPYLPLQLMKSMINYPCGNLELFNYPKALRTLIPTDNDGLPLSDRILDLAAIDIYRDRERGIRKYNDFRRGLHLKPFRNYHDLTDGNEEAMKALSDVYGPDGIEHVDLLIGTLAEKQLMKGFVLSETSFYVFLIMAGRRLETDRFLNKDMRPEIYTQTGLDWLQYNVKHGLQDLVDRHWPELKQQSGNGKRRSAFTPTKTWPFRFLQEQET